MTKYNDLCNEARAFGEKNDCSVKALAVAANLSYHNAHIIMRDHGRIKGRGLRRSHILNAMAYAGLKLENITKMIPDIRTVRAFERFHGNIKGTFVIFVKGHVLTWKDGKTEDWSANSCKRILEVYYVQNAE